MKKYEFVIVDVFTDVSLRGNPVAVFLDASDFTATQMQQIANEMHLSETVFVLPPENGGDARVRIFTPVNELPFAGHPTLGTAIVLGDSYKFDRLRMETAMGTIPFVLTRKNDGRVKSARMWQPIPTWEPYEQAKELLAGLGLKSSTHPVEVYCNGPRHVFVGVDTVEKLSSIRPDHRILAQFPNMATNCFAGSGSQWKMRMFSPAYGVVEDAATGSAAGPLAIHLTRYGKIPPNTPIEIQQGCEIGRPSTMHAIARGSVDQIESVEVGGSAVEVITGSMML